MIARFSALRPLTFVIAVLMMAAAFTLDVQTAQAKCCLITIANTTDCDFEAILATDYTKEYIKVHAGVKNQFKIPDCGNWTVYVYDACTGQYTPFTYGSCGDVRLNRACCVNLCNDGYDPCTLIVTYGRCHHCYLVD